MMPQYYATITRPATSSTAVLETKVFETLNAGLQADRLGAKTPAQVAAEMQSAQDR